MSLLAADGHIALFGTPEGDSYCLPLVCWRDDGTTVHGLVLHRGALRQAELVPGLRRYAHGSETVPAFAPEEPRPRYADTAG
jgi:hypothetical protein